VCQTKQKNQPLYPKVCQMSVKQKKLPKPAISRHIPNKNSKKQNNKDVPYIF
jgi:hypothetical protein